MSKYKDLIYLDDKKVKETQKLDAIENAQNIIQNSLFAAKRAVRDYERELKAAKSSVNFDPSVIITAQKNLEETQSDLKRLEDLNSELF